jgi:aldose 1-epimerase
VQNKGKITKKRANTTPWVYVTHALYKISLCKTLSLKVSQYIEQHFAHSTALIHCMFAVETNTRDGFELVVLKDLSSNTYTEIIPACGGILHSFNVWHDSAFLNVIDHYENNDDFKKNVTSKGFKSCKLSPFACRMQDGTYSFGEDTYTIQKFLLNGSALHGLLYDANFNVIYQYADDQHAGIAIEYKYRAEDKGYPFAYDCVITYHLKKNNELIISTDIFNRGDDLIPVQDGWHPYFTFGGKIDDLMLEFQSKERLVFNKDMIPTGKIVKYKEFASLKKIGSTQFDDCFTLNMPVPVLRGFEPVCVLRDAEKQIQIEIRPDKTYPYLQLYTPEHRNSIAIENLSAPPDTFNNGIDLKIIPPDANRIFTTSYTVTLLDL